MSSSLIRNRNGKSQTYMIKTSFAEGRDWEEIGRYIVLLFRDESALLQRIQSIWHKRWCVLVFRINAKAKIVKRNITSFYFTAGANFRRLHSFTFRNFTFLCYSGKQYNDEASTRKHIMEWSSHFWNINSNIVVLIMHGCIFLQDGNDMIRNGLLVLRKSTTVERVDKCVVSVVFLEYRITVKPPLRNCHFLNLSIT
jgi:hypothetical protein